MNWSRFFFITLGSIIIRSIIDIVLPGFPLVGPSNTDFNIDNMDQNPNDGNIATHERPPQSKP